MKQIQQDQFFGVISQSKKNVLLSLPIPPSANRYWRMSGHHIIVSEEAKAYKQMVRLFCGQVDRMPGDVAVSFTVYRARKSGDLDNYTKVMLDALKGTLYEDDSAVVEIHAKRADDKDNPRVVFEAWRA